MVLILFRPLTYVQIPVGGVAEARADLGQTVVSGR